MLISNPSPVMQTVIPRLGLVHAHGVKMTEILLLLLVIVVVQSLP